MTRVAVTGLGAVSSIGIGKNAFWNSLLEGKSGISPVTLFDTSKYQRHNAGQIKDFKAEKILSKAKTKFLGRASQFSIAAAKMALKDAGLSASDLTGRKVAVLMGTTMSEANSHDVVTQLLLKNEWTSLDKNILLNVFFPSIPFNIGNYLKIKGTNALIPNACAAGNFALAYGYDLIERGEADLVIAGGAEALSRIAFQGFQRLYAMATDVCRPFDKNRKGMMLGEGAGILILEPQALAKKRNAKIYADMLGYGISCDAHHMTQPKKEGVAKAMAKAIKKSGISADKIDYISAHGTGTPANDKGESQAINEVFKRKVPVSSIKSMLGHCMGAAASLSAIACCMAVRNQAIPPTINFQTPDPDCDIDCVPNVSRKLKVNAVMNNGFAFGGNNCCVVFQSPD
jgi:3-oxoacyl-[acyl-carrier-protein] synthase II